MPFSATALANLINNIASYNITTISLLCTTSCKLEFKFYNLNLSTEHLNWYAFLELSTVEVEFLLESA